MIVNEKNITGTQINYYFICKTKLWLFSHHIQMEHENEDVRIGKLLHETRFQRTKKEIIIDNTIAVDFIKKGDTLEIHDIKKSKKMRKAHKLQLLYYLYYLKQRGIDAIGVLNYPLLNKKETLKLKAEDIIEIETTIKDINAIINDKMPIPIKRNMCGKCSYYEFCFGGL